VSTIKRTHQFAETRMCRSLSSHTEHMIWILPNRMRKHLGSVDTVSMWHVPAITAKRSRKLSEVPAHVMPLLSRPEPQLCLCARWMTTSWTFIITTSLAFGVRLSTSANTPLGIEFAI
jgi:hypothetical protein